MNLYGLARKDGKNTENNVPDMPEKNLRVGKYSRTLALVSQKGAG